MNDLAAPAESVSGLNPHDQGDADVILIVVNGETRRFAAPLTIVALLDTMGLDCRKIAVERNLAIVPRSLHATTVLAHNDQLEIVHFIGGG